MVERSQLKEWAKKTWRGVGNNLMPSFTPDLTELDEEGIRWDVQQSIKHGFFLTLCEAITGLTFEEAKRFVEIMVDEGKGKIITSICLAFDSFDQQMDMLKHAETVGCDSVLLNYPPSFYPKSEEEIFQATKEMCDATNMAIILFPSFKYNFARFHPSGFPIDLLERIAEIENVVAVKIGTGDVGFVFECFRRIGDRILVNYPFEKYLPMLVRDYGQQWMGTSAFELYQSPEKPYLVDYFNMLVKGEVDKAMEIYWKLTPVRTVFESQLMAVVTSGNYHWPQWKYYQWLVGGNGGMTRQPVNKLLQHDMEACKNALRAIGITSREPDEEFFVGRLNYAKMKMA